MVLSKKEFTCQSPIKNGHRTQNQSRQCSWLKGWRHCPFSVQHKLLSHSSSHLVQKSINGNWQLNLKANPMFPFETISSLHLDQGKNKPSSQDIGGFQGQRAGHSCLNTISKLHRTLKSPGEFLKVLVPGCTPQSYSIISAGASQTFGNYKIFNL